MHYYAKKKICYDDLKFEKSYKESDKTPMNALLLKDKRLAIVYSNNYLVILNPNRLDNTSSAIKFSPHAKNFLDISVFPDGRLLTYTSDGEVKIWRVEEKTCEWEYILQVRVEEGSCNIIALSNNRIATAVRDFQINIWRTLEPFASLGYLEGHKGWVEVMVQPEGKEILISASSDKTLRVWDLVKYEQVKCFSGVNCHFKNSMAFYDERTVMVQSTNHTLKFINFETFKVRETSNEKWLVENVVCILRLDNGLIIFEFRRNSTIGIYNEREDTFKFTTIYDNKYSIQALVRTNDYKLIFINKDNVDLYSYRHVV